ncbi:hypothetical protein B0H63DRAFT_472479 [Podospora didyma]|uniref:Uncharacterized protein n=1 Tax=Podospora didyma TaxID=330526 RepID=A0AAE0NPE8_9PEZI|nr:hypothetical protein B0H63DRAFT_472479 [Podospora didyma]
MALVLGFSLILCCTGWKPGQMDLKRRWESTLQLSPHTVSQEVAGSEAGDCGLLRKARPGVVLVAGGCCGSEAVSQGARGWLTSLGFRRCGGSSGSKEL